VAKVVEIIT